MLLLSWSALVLAHVAGFAVVQVDGGLLTAPDKERRLQDGVRALVEGHDTRANLPRSSIEIGAFEVLRTGQVALLRPLPDECGETTSVCPVPLILKPRTQLPRGFVLCVPIDPAELSEGVSPNSLAIPSGWTRPAPDEPRHPLHCCPEDILRAMQRGACCK